MRKVNTSRQVGQLVVDPGRTECTVRGATELGVMLGDGCEEGRSCGLEREPGGSVSALSMTLVRERNGLPHEWNEKSM